MGQEVSFMTVYNALCRLTSLKRLYSISALPLELNKRSKETEGAVSALCFSRSTLSHSQYLG